MLDKRHHQVLLEIVFKRYKESNDARIEAESYIE